MEISSYEPLRIPFIYQAFFCEALNYAPLTKGKQGQVYSLSLLAMCVLFAKLTGRNGQREMAIFLSCQWELIIECLQSIGQGSIKIRRQAPSQSTISRFMSNPDNFLISYLYYQLILNTQRLQPGELRIINIDGKFRGNCFNSETGRFDADISLFDTKTGEACGVVQCLPGEGESAAAVRLLNEYKPDLKQKVITADAAYYSEEFLNAIVAAKAEYLLSIKGNTKGLHTLLKQQRWKSLNTYKTRDSKRGRKEYRKYTFMPLESFSDEVDISSCKIPNLGGFLRVETKVKREGKETQSVFYYAVSIGLAQLTVADIAKVARSHWQIENCLHWVKDAVLKEDSHPRQSLFSSRMQAFFNNIVVKIGKAMKSSVKLFLDYVSADPRKWLLAILSGESIG